MRSRFADRFNHDADAAGYDRDVQNEADPIRAGYRAVLEWTARNAAAGPDSVVLDLGAGTGGLGLLLPPCRKLVCVDVSREMSRIGRAKLATRPNVTWVQEDLLEYLDDPGGPFDVAVSTYAVHHLLPEEKSTLFGALAARLRPGGRAVFGDLMFEDAAARADLLRAYRESDREALAGEIESEFFWDLDRETRALRDAGFRTDRRRFSELSWGVLAVREPA
jgi:putative AdoMet-dependent methyltransferase